MAVSSSDIKLYKALVNNDTAANGGKISPNLVTSGAVADLFPNVTDAELAAGGTRYRKVFAKNENADDIAWQNVLARLKQMTAGNDWYRIKPGTDTDAQAEAEAYTDWSGTGTLNSAASIGDTSIEVLYDDADGVYDGANLLISDGGVTEVATVSGAPAWAGNVATVTLSAGLANGFTTAAQVETRPALDDLTPTKNSWVETLTAGAFDESQVVLYNKGTVSGSFTLTFTDGSGSFSVSEATLGAIGTGSIAADFQPANGTSYYFKLPAAAWSGGTPSSGDTITWNTVHAARSVWMKEKWNAGAGSLLGNTATFAVTGASASL
jgi:hypothetical protein